MSKSKELFNNTIFLAFGSFSRQAASLILLPIYTIYFSPKELGSIDLILTYLTLLVPIFTLQLETATFRYLIDSKSVLSTKKILSSSFAVIALMLCVLLGSALLFSTIINSPYYMLIVINAALMMCSSLLLQIARGLGKNNKFAIAGFISSISTILVTVSMLTGFKGSGEVVLIALGISNLLSALYLFYSLGIRKYLAVSHVRKKVISKMLHYALPLIPTGLSWWVMNVSDRTIISITLGLSANGIYAVANKYVGIYMSLFSILAMSFTESASKHINKKDGAMFISKVFNASIRLFGSIGLVLIAFCPLIINTFIGKEFRSAKQYVPILIASAFLSSAVSLLGAVYIAMKKTKAVASIAVMAAIMNFAFTFLLIGYIKIYAAAIATLLSFLIILIQRSINIKKYITIQFDKKIYAFIALCYSATFTLYYLNNTACTIINCLFVLFIAVKLNANSIILLRTKVLERIQFNKSRIGLIDENL